MLIQKIKDIYGGKGEVNDDFIPGTVHLVDTSHDLNVEKMKGGDSDIILQPQPLDDVNDPLRWLQKKKNFQFSMLFVWSVFLAVAVNWTGPYYTEWTEEFNCTLGQINIYQGLIFLFLGIGCAVLQPTALKLGRRFVYLLCTILGIVGNAIGINATRIQTLYASGVLLGLAAAPVDSLVEISSTDVFFIHERASRLSFLVLALYFGSDIGPVVASYLPSWNWAYRLQVIILCVLFVILLFLLHDSTFARPEEEAEKDILLQIKSRETGQEVLYSDQDKKVMYTSQEEETGSLETGAGKRSYLKKLQILELEYNDKRSWWTLFVSPIFTALFPAVLWSGVVYGAQMMWLSLLSTTQSLVYTEYYGFGTSATGLTNLAPLVGSIIGMCYGGWFVDWLSVKIARKNNGVMESEFRLWAMIVPTLLNAAGLLAYGLASVNRNPWPVSVVIGQGFLGFAMSSSGPICLTYTIDSYPKLASDSLVLMLFTRNMIGCGFTFAIDPWINKDGLVQTTWLMFMLSVVINGGFVVFLIWGKTFRIKTRRIYGILAK